MATFGPLYYGQFLPQRAAFYTATSFTLDANNDKIYFVFTAPASAPNLTKCAIRWGSVTGTAPVYRVSLQSVDLSTGYASGTILQEASTDISYVISTPPTGAGVVEYTFAHSYQTTPGQLMALVVDYSSGTINSGACASVSRSASGASMANALPYAQTVDGGGTPSNLSSSLFGVSDGTTWWGDDLWDNSNYTSVSSASFLGNRFTVPSGVGDTVSCPGFWWVPRDFGMTTYMRVNLYNSSDTLLASTDVDGHTCIPNTSLANVARCQWNDGVIALTCGAMYRIVATTDAGAFNLGTYVVANAAHLSMATGGTDFHKTSGSTGSWTDTTTARMDIGPIIDAITEPAGGGGIIGTHQFIGLGR